MWNLKNDAKKLTAAYLNNDIIGWMTDVPVYFEIGKRIASDRLSIRKAGDLAVRIGTQMSCDRYKKKFRNMKQVRRYVNNKISAFINWEKRNDIDLYNFHFASLENVFRDCGLKREAIRVIVNDILLTLRIGGVDLPPEGTLACSEDFIRNELRERALVEVANNIDQVFDDD